MNYLKRIVAVATTALAALALLGATTSSATELYKYTTPSANDTLGVGTTLTASIKAGTSSLLRDTFMLSTATCVSGELQVKIENAGGEGSHPRGKVSGGFGLCSHFVPIVNGGEMEFRHIAGTTNATVIWKNFETSFPSTLFGIQCIAKGGAEAAAGTLTGIGSATGHATLDINMQLTFVPAGGGGFSCGDGPWTATFTVTNPTGLIVEAK